MRMLTNPVDIVNANIILKSLKNPILILKKSFLGDCCLFDENAYESCRYCECKYDPVEIMSDARHYPTDSCLYRNTGAYQDGFCHDELNTGDLSLLC